MLRRERLLNPCPLTTKESLMASSYRSLKRHPLSARSVVLAVTAMAAGLICPACGGGDHKPATALQGDGRPKLTARTAPSSAPASRTLHYASNISGDLGGALK